LETREWTLETLILAVKHFGKGKINAAGDEREAMIGETAAAVSAAK